MANKTVVVLGGGISGLSCAYYLHKLCANINCLSKIIVLEKTNHLGGWLKTHTFDDGVSHELGPKTIRSATNSGFNALTLVEDLGLTSEVIETPLHSIASKKRMILVNNELVVLPNRLTDLFKRHKPFNKRLISYVLQDFRTKKVDLSQYGNDISVHDFINHRMGPEIADYFFDPLCRGITAGNSKKLSLMSLFPALLRGEQESGSLIMGNIVNNKRDAIQVYTSPLVQRAKADKWNVYTFRKGIQTLPNRLCQYMLDLDGKPIEIYNESTVNKIEFNSESNSATICVNTKEEDNIQIKADYIFSSISANNLSNILPKNNFNDLCEALNGISSVHMAVVNLEFKGKVMADDSGFGFLVPSKEESDILGIVFDSCVSPQFNSGHDITRLTVMIGGEWFESVLGDINSVDKQTVLNIAVKAVQKYLKINSDPIRHIVSIHSNCIPQYYLGHQQRLQSINQLMKKYGLNIGLIGASYQGFSVPDCIYFAKLAAQGYADILKGIGSSNSETDSLKQKQQIIQ